MLVISKVYLVLIDKEAVLNVALKDDKWLK